MPAFRLIIFLFFLIPVFCSAAEKPTNDEMMSWLKSVGLSMASYNDTICYIGTPSDPCPPHSRSDNCVGNLVYASSMSINYQGCPGTWIRYSNSSHLTGAVYIQFESDCFESEPDKYFVDSYCVCTDSGEGIYFSYGQCQDDAPSGDLIVIGNTKLYTSIKSEIPVEGLNAQCSSPGGGCAYELQDIEDMKSSLAPSWGSACGTDFDDDDGDGVANEDDNCPMTPEGSIVDQFGCSLPDSDGDGVDDDHDSCPGTPAGITVDSFGCPVDHDDDDYVPDSDGDGVDDDHDSCPGTPAGTTVGPDGCPPPPDSGDGDDDDDNELLSDIVDWLKNISGTADTISNNVSDIEDVNNSILDSQRQTTNKIQDQIDEQKETNAELDDVNHALTDIKTAIMNQDSKLSGIESNTGILADLVQDDDSLDSSWAGVDGSDYNSNNFATDFEEGTDFETVPEISENTGISDFLTSNPLKTALDASGFDLSGSCSYSVDLGSVFGSKTIDICSLEPVFDSAGMIFYGLSILSGLLMIARGF